MRFKFVSLDLNGTILKPARPIGDIYSEAGGKFGIQASAESLTSNFKKSMKLMGSSHPNFGRTSGLGWKNWWIQIVDLTFRETLGKEVNQLEPNLKKLSNFLVKKFESKEPWVLCEGANELLEELKSSHIPVGAVTNSDPRVNGILKDFDLDKYFSFVVTSYEANVCKPDRKIFELAEDKFRTNSENFDRKYTVHVGDSYEKDYIGAINMGWNAILISNITTSKDEINKSVFNNLNEVRHYFKC